MTPIVLEASDLAAASLVLLADAGLSVAFGLGLHRTVLWSAVRMSVQLVLVGYGLRLVFAAGSPGVILAVVAVMMAVAVRETAVRPRGRLARGVGNIAVSAVSIGVATGLTVLLALTTALRPAPWWDPRIAIPIVGIVLGGALNAASLALDTVLGGVALERPGIEAQLALGVPFIRAVRPLGIEGIRRGMLPVVNQMAAAGLVTLPGAMSGQILAGLDPLMAVTYQILIMLLLAGASGLSAGLATCLAVRRLKDERDRLRLDQLC